MKAIIQHAYGTADVLTLEDTDSPTVGANDVLIRVRAASINHADLVYITGQPLIARVAFGVNRPRQMVRGKDVAGTVEKIGTNVTAFRPGDDVYGELVAGSFAEYAVASVDQIARKPRNLTFAQAGTVPLAAMTALQGLRDAGALKPGQRVLINGASGGVGTFAVQIAKALGGDVTAVCSAGKTDLVRSLGADHTLDYTLGAFTTGATRYDLIFDLVGNHSLTALRRVLTRKGTLVLASGTGNRMFGPMGRVFRAAAVSPFVSQRLVPFSQSGTAATLNDLNDLIESGQVTPTIERTYPLAETPDAARNFAHGHPAGKLAISL